MPKDTKSLDNNKAPACESRGFVHKKKEGVHFDTPSTPSKITGNVFENDRQCFLKPWATFSKTAINV